jgi:DHA2 family multidrug resistance protein
MGLMGSVFLIPIFAQTFLGLDATQSGYLFIPMAVFFVASAPIGGHLIGKVRPSYVIAASTFVAGVGIYFLSYIDPRSTVWAIMIPMSIMAFGMGFGMAQRTSLVANAVPKEEIGVASGVLALVRNIAGAFGIAFFNTILDNAANAKIIALSRLSTIHTTDPFVYKQAVALMMLKAQVSAYGSVFVVAAVLLVIGGVAALFIKIQHVEGAETVHIMID